MLRKVEDREARAVNVRDVLDELALRELLLQRLRVDGHRVEDELHEESLVPLRKRVERSELLDNACVRDALRLPERPARAVRLLQLVAVRQDVTV